MRQLTANVFGILTLGGGLNGYLVQGEDGLTLVDTGTAGFHKSVEKALAQLGRSMSDIRRIFITHAHPDHIGDLPALQQVTNATTYAHRLDAAVIRGERPLEHARPEALGRMNRLLLAQLRKQVLPVSRVEIDVDDEQMLNEIRPGAQVIHLPGHSHGHSGLYLPDDRTLIGGDVLMRMPWGLVLPLRVASPDWDAVKQSIRKAAGLPIDHLMLGHGAPLMGGAQAALQRFVTKF